MINLTPDISLSEDELQFTAIKASGPGGQHVNTTNSAVQLRFDAKAFQALTHPQFIRLKKLAGKRMTSEGIIILQVSDVRSQHRNKSIAIERLVKLITSSLTPQKKRKKTRPSKSSNKKRLETKAKTSKLKKTRARVKNEAQ